MNFKRTAMLSIGLPLLVLVTLGAGSTAAPPGAPQQDSLRPVTKTDIRARRATMTTYRDFQSDVDVPRVLGEVQDFLTLKGEVSPDEIGAHLARTFGEGRYFPDPPRYEYVSIEGVVYQVCISSTNYFVAEMGGPSRIVVTVTRTQFL